MGLALSSSNLSTKSTASNAPLRIADRHPLIIGSAALSLLTAVSSGRPLICSAFAASPAPTVRRSQFYCPRGGSLIKRNMSERDNYKRAPPLATVSPFSRPIKKIVIVGGTHGNEYTGVWCIKSIEKQRDHISKKSHKSTPNIFNDFPSLDIATLLANPEAYMQNKRFVDADLNRQFSVKKLKQVAANSNSEKEECDISREFCSDDDPVIALPHESIRAREIEGMLGPKVPSDAADNMEPLTDVVVDLHTTTANMGISLIIPEGDALMSAAAAYVLHQCKTKYRYDSVQCLMHALPKRADRQNLSSCGRHGFTIEVGPVPQGVLRHDVIEKTQAAMHSLLEFLHLRNIELEEGNDNASRVLSKLQEIYPNNIVPCYRSAPAVRPGELSGKISWKNDSTNPNFPEVIIHKSLQDRDFEPLNVGDPLFVTLDGTIIPYDGSHGDEVYLIFVNEGGYYYASSGTGIGVAVKSRFDWATGWFFADSDDDGEASEEVVVEEKDSYE